MTTKHVQDQDSHGRVTLNDIPTEGNELVLSVFEFNMRAALVKPGHFDANRVGFYVGMMLEELAETLEAISEGCVTHADRARIEIFAATMDSWGKEFKADQHHGSVLRGNREKLLDGSIDVAVVSLGAIMYQTPMWLGAISTVLKANARKCPGGVATHDANGKIMKPAGWTPPYLGPYVDKPID
jgi:predicted HAD superfamily Cof-like phosphohydrolase